MGAPLDVCTRRSSWIALPSPNNHPVTQNPRKRISSQFFFAGIVISSPSGDSLMVARATGTFTIAILSPQRNGS
jgi:hypothetical protein